MSDTINAIRKLDKEKILRPSYGQTSLLKWEPEFNNFLQKLDCIQKYWHKVDTKTNQQVQSALNNILAQLQQIMKNTEAQFVTNKESFINQFFQYSDEIKQHYSKYVIEAIEESGILTNSDLKNQIDNYTTTIKTTTDNALKSVEAASEKIIDNVTKKAENIEHVARQTAKGISVLEAQKQFENAAKDQRKNIKIWAIITSSLIIVFLISILCMLLVCLPDQWTWKMIYYSALRITILGFIGTLLAFSLRILKSHLHMLQHNLHRQRIANSMASFGESVISDDQRDLILSKMIDSVVAFGNSGIISNDEDGNSKIIIDNITRTLNTIKPTGH